MLGKGLLLLTMTAPAVEPVIIKVGKLYVKRINNFSGGAQIPVFATSLYEDKTILSHLYRDPEISGAVDPQTRPFVVLAVRQQEDLAKMLHPAAHVQILTHDGIVGWLYRTRLDEFCAVVVVNTSSTGDDHDDQG